jgi:hypothetical protein
MTITDLVAPEAILPALKVNSKKQALQELSAKAAELTGQNERAVFEVLLQREKLISRRWTVSRSTSFFSCLRRRGRVPII